MTESKASQIFVRTAGAVLAALILAGLGWAWSNWDAIASKDEIRWALRAGNYEGTCCLIRFPGNPNPSEAQKDFNLVMSSAVLHEGEISATLKTEGEIGACRAHFVFGFQDDARAYFTAGLGGDGAAFSIGSQDDRTNWRPLAKSGNAGDLQPSRFYELNLAIADGIVSLGVDGDPRLTRHVGSLAETSRIGVLAEGCGRVEFLCTEFGDRG